MIETEGRIILLTNFDALKERARTTPFYLSIIEETL
jgi:hypothetical protein